MVGVADGAGVLGNALGAGAIDGVARFSVAAAIEGVTTDVCGFVTTAGGMDDLKTLAVGASLAGPDDAMGLQPASAKSVMATSNWTRMITDSRRLHVESRRSVIDSVGRLPSAQTLRDAHCKFPLPPIVYCKRVGVQKNNDAAT